MGMGANVYLMETIKMADYQNSKPQKIRFHVTAGAENIDLVDDLIGHLAKAKDYEVTFHKIKQRGRTPLVDLQRN